MPGIGAARPSETVADVWRSVPSILDASHQRTRWRGAQSGRARRTPPAAISSTAHRHVAEPGAGALRNHATTTVDPAARCLDDLAAFQTRSSRRRA
jgi:hypothetical protein